MGRGRWKGGLEGRKKKIPPAEVKHLEGEDALPTPTRPLLRRELARLAISAAEISAPPIPGPPLPDAPIPRRYLAGGAGSGRRRQVVLSRKRASAGKFPSSGQTLADSAPPRSRRVGRQQRGAGAGGCAGPPARARQSAGLGLRRRLSSRPPPPAPPAAPPRSPTSASARHPEPLNPRPASPPASQSPPSSLSLRLIHGLTSAGRVPSLPAAGLRCHPLLVQG